MISVGVDVALIISTALFLGEQALVIAEIVAADGITGSISLYTATRPTQVFGFVLGDKVVRQFAVSIQIERYIFGCRILPSRHRDPLRIAFHHGVLQTHSSVLIRRDSSLND